MDQQQHKVPVLVPSIFGKAPIDPLTKLVADFMFPYLNDPEIEIEAKFGVIVDKHTNNRVNFPIKNDAVLWEDSWFRFESNMTMGQHAHFNKILNDRVSEKGSGVKYAHTKEIDEFYTDGSQKIRVTRDEATRKVIRTLKKDKLAHLHIMIPYTPLDCRISINREVKMPENVTGVATSSRRKDRLSYMHQLFHVDLTQVKNEDRGQSEVTHELELEITEKALFAQEAQKAASGQDNKYLHLISVFINNIRALSTKGQQSQ